MSALIAFILQNPTILAIMGGVLSTLGWGFVQRRAGAKAATNAQKAKEADAYAKHLQDITDAANARPTRGVQSDPHNRDNG